MSHGASRPYMEPLSSYSTSTSIRDSEDTTSFRKGADDSGGRQHVYDYFARYHSGSFCSTHSNLEAMSRAVQWSLEHRKYQCLKQLGAGTYGTVYKAERRDRGQHNAVAMKVCRIDQSPELGLPETAVREAALLVELRGHPNVMNLWTVSCSKADKLYLVCELLDMDLKSYLRRHPVRQLLWTEARHVARCLLKGLAHCHARGIVHRDLKPHNILVSRNLSQVKIADFGLGRWLHNSNKTLTHEVVTLWYRPPEVLLGDCRYDASIDIWSAGCVIVEMLTGKPLFQGTSEIDTLFKIFKLLGTPTIEEWPEMAFEDRAIFPTFPGEPEPFKCLLLGHDYQDLWGLLKGMLSVVPSKRPTSWECLQHPWILRDW
eukprot:Gregarina_sp_Pseudo_9__1946@NODE_233_length_3487_cov_75_999420_g217_i0_p1_GENE_NODE_233_length_3487_cov_75_999420_g217_i0NODE_233_length_3487_cov_75_999420_g217_i0_p1_ORF_typecomplete_len373_score0_00Pkinase/PF00069_25/8_2e66Pkinase_Tyr/PF07714_17/5_1e42Kinaselike/PF14531_6/3_1e12Kdo/PF06293_14/9e10Pkinase_fungal/PF17667_1/1_2e05RIO1/PF01163_22/5_5e05WaaY/PF06176_11/7_6e05APH/PF01636_23/0_00015Haspin_kinase/PF12330_8/0_011FTA2/PF13095_6/0_041EcKinase/PF02958_20/2_2e02EcKinase/PF02958_20/0_13YrbL